MSDQEDGNNFVLDIEMMYGKELEYKIPNIRKQDKECIKQILIDVMDLSMNEYTMHYILHSENKFMTPYQDLKNRINNELFKFYKTSCESTPFKLWSEIIDEHCLILSNFLPVTILKELHEYRFTFVKKYTKNRIKYQLKKYSEKCKRNKQTEVGQSMRVFNTDNGVPDPTVMTSEEYLEMTVAEFLNTPFNDYLVSCLKNKSSKSTILSLLAHIKENEIDIMNVYNHNFGVNSKFKTDTKFKNAMIEKYKKPRGFPLKLKSYEDVLYSMDEAVTIKVLENFKAEKDKEAAKKREMERKIADKPFSATCSIDPDSEEDEMPFDFEAGRVRYSNTEKRTSKFDPLSSLSLMKNVHVNDVDMEVEEEDKSETSKPEKANRPSLGSISSLFKSNLGESKDITDAFPSLDDSSSLQGLRLKRTSNIS